MASWLIGYGIAVAGSLGEVIGMVAMAKRSINHVAANRQIARLVEASNLSRAVKLCAAVGESTYLRSIELAILAGARTQSTDRATIRDAVTTAFDAEAKPRAVAYKRVMIGGLLASIVALAGCVLVIAMTGTGRNRGGAPAFPIGACALFAGIGFALRIGKFDAAIADTRHHLLPSIIEALASGASAT